MPKGNIQESRRWILVSVSSLGLGTLYFGILLYQKHRKRRKVLKKSVLKLPKHIAFIMDGNRRFGIKRYGEKLQGHIAGGKKLAEVIDWCLELGIHEVSCFAFSTENWQRDPQEIDIIMTYFLHHLHDLEIQALKKNIRVRFISSDPEKIPKQCFDALEDLQTNTQHFTTLSLNLCISYGARSEILHTAKAWAKKTMTTTSNICTTAKNKYHSNNNHHHPTTTNTTRQDTAFDSHLLLPSSPDLLIRTSGEQRLSNFLLWQIAYTELIFIDKLWPELLKHDFLHILHNFANRKRRYGR